MIRVCDQGIFVLSSFPVHFSSVFLHEDRLICDNYVYSMVTFALMQTLDHDMISGCVLTSKLICCGHGIGGKLSLWSWTGSSYDLIRKTTICQSSLPSLPTHSPLTLPQNAPGNNMACISQLQKAQFTSLPNQIFLIESKTTLIRLTINAKDIRNSEKLKMKS